MPLMAFTQHRQGVRLRSDWSQGHFRSFIRAFQAIYPHGHAPANFSDWPDEACAHGVLAVLADVRAAATEDPLTLFYEAAAQFCTHLTGLAQTSPCQIALGPFWLGLALGPKGPHRLATPPYSDGDERVATTFSRNDDTDPSLESSSPQEGRPWIPTLESLLSFNALADLVRRFQDECEQNAMAPPSAFLVVGLMLALDEAVCALHSSESEAEFEGVVLSEGRTVGVALTLQRDLRPASQR